MEKKPLDAPKRREVNQTAICAGCVVGGAAVLVALMDGGLTTLTFQLVTGTTGYFIHELCVDDLPKQYQEHARDVLINGNVMMTGANVLAGIGVAADPIIGSVLLALTIGAHAWLDHERKLELSALKKSLVALAMEAGAMELPGEAQGTPVPAND